MIASLGQGPTNLAMHAQPVGLRLESLPSSFVGKEEDKKHQSLLVAARRLRHVVNRGHLGETASRAWERSPEVFPAHTG